MSAKKERCFVPKDMRDQCSKDEGQQEISPDPPSIRHLSKLS